jgi:hypothetical protein
MKWIAALLLLPQFSFAQNLNCAVKYRDKVTPMYWFEMDHSHHSPLEYLTATVQEKSEPGKVEITIMEAVEDDVWERFDALTKDLEPEYKQKIRDLGRTRITHAFVGLYAGVLQYEFRLGTDPNLYEISCASSAK